MNIRCALGAIPKPCSIQKILKRVVYKAREWLNKSDQPKYLSGKGRLK